MSWDLHTDYVANKAVCALGLTYRHRDLLPAKTRLLVYHSLFMSYVKYCFLVWGTTTSTNILKLKRLQNKKIREIANTAPNHPARPLLKKYGLISLDHLYNFKLCYALRNDMEKNTHYLCSVGNLDVHTHRYNTRHFEYLEVRPSRTNNGKGRLCCIITRILNNFYEQNLNIEYFTLNQLRRYYM